MTAAPQNSTLRKPFKTGVSWSQEQQNILRSCWGKEGMTLAAIGRKVGRSPAAVRKLAIILGLHNGTDHRFKGSNPLRADYQEPVELPPFIVGAQDGMLQVYVATFADTPQAAAKAIEWVRKSGRKAALYRLISEDELKGGSKDETVSGSCDCACGCCSGSQSGASVRQPAPASVASGDGSRPRRGPRNPRQVRQSVRRAGREGRDD
jgi:hypothetical protein